MKHKWNPISTQDMMEWAKIVAKLYSDGYGVIDRKKAYELMNWDAKELESQQGCVETSRSQLCRRISKNS